MDDVDERIAALLSEDGRRSNRELARLIGVAEGTIRNRIRRLLADDVMQIVAGVNPEWQGYTIDCSVSLRVAFDQVQQVAEQLAALPEIRYLALTTGADDIRFTVMFKSQEDFATFFAEYLHSIPGIHRVTTSIAVTVRKHTYDWRPSPRPDDADEGNGIDSHRSPE